MNQSRVRRFALVAALSLAAACGGGNDIVLPPSNTPTDTGTPTPTTTSTLGSNVIEVADNEYRPPETTIAAGTEVVWTSSGAAPHSVTSDDGTSFDSHPMCTGADPSKCLAAGQTFRHVFATAGRFAYHCRVHGAGMAGVIVVS